MFFRTLSRSSTPETSNSPNSELRGWRERLNEHHRLDIAVRLQDIIPKRGMPNERKAPMDPSQLQQICSRMLSVSPAEVQQWQDDRQCKTEDGMMVWCCA